MPRFMMIAFIMTFLGLAVIGKALYIMTAKKQYWTEVADRLKRDSVSVKPNRGNILSCDGQLMATSIPEYKIFMDFQASAFDDDSLWLDKLDSVCEGLNKIFPQRTAEEFKQLLEEGRHKKNRNGSVGSRWWNIWPRRIDYNTYMEVKQLPFFNMPKYKSGFHEEEFISRRRPFGSLAQRTIGGMYGAKDSAYFGLELSYDSILRGTPGITGRRKVLNKYMNIPVTMPIDGCDIVTTIDVNMQDLAERALTDELKLVNGEMGVAILMEVETGDVKAIVNMMRNENGNYIEAVNSAISYRCEPGFGIQGGFIPGGTRRRCGRHQLRHPHRQRHHAHARCQDEGPQLAPRRLWRHQCSPGTRGELEHRCELRHRQVLRQQAQTYVKGLYRVGIHEDLKLPLVGYHPPYIRMPDTKTQDRSKYWSKTTLPWMSIGYETQIAPINTVTFYNAIANNGKMMQPRFVKKVVKNGETIKEFRHRSSRSA